MSDFKAKMQQIRSSLGLCPRPHWMSLQRSPDPIAIGLFEGFISKRRKRGEMERKQKVKGREDEVEGGIWPTQKFWRSAPYVRRLAGFIPAARGRGEERKGTRGAGKGKSGRKVGTGPPIG